MGTVYAVVGRSFLRRRGVTVRTLTRISADVVEHTNVALGEQIRRDDEKGGYRRGLIMMPGSETVQIHLNGGLPEDFPE